MEPSSRQPAKREGKRERKAENQKFEAAYNRRIPWSPPAGSRQKEKEKERGKPKIRNLRRYIIGGYLGASSRQPAKREGKRERKAETQKFEAVYNRRIPWSLQPAAGKKRRKERRGKPKVRNLRRYIVGGYLGASSQQPAKREGKRERKAKNQKFEALYNRRIPWSLQPAAGKNRRKEGEESQKSEI